MRSYKAARRAAERAEGAPAPVPFEVTYEEAKLDPKTGRKVYEEITEQFAADGDLSSATLADMAFFADIPTVSPAGMGILRRVFAELIGDEVEFARFWRIAPKLGDDVLLGMMKDLAEDVMGRPTTRPSDSSASSSTSGQPSRVVSLAPGSSSQETPDAFSA